MFFRLFPSGSFLAAARTIGFAFRATGLPTVTPHRQNQSNRAVNNMLRSDGYYFEQAKKLTETKSTCLKIKTAAVIVKGGKIVGRGYNLCSPEGFNHGKEVKKCLRMGVPSGTGYELCKSLHAEVVAVADAGIKNCQGAILYLSGHFYPCWHCESLAKITGIKEIKVQDVGAGEFYRRSK